MDFGWQSKRGLGSLLGVSLSLLVPTSAHKIFPFPIQTCRFFAVAMNADGKHGRKQAVQKQLVYLAA